MHLQYYYDFSKEFERGHNLIEEKYGRMMESTTPAEYVVIKELDRACVQVAVYDDRVEITSPRMLYGGLTIEQIIGITGDW